MRLVLLTSTGLRHAALAAKLQTLGPLTMIAETRRLAPVGGPAMAEHHRRVAAAEAEVFGAVSLAGIDVRVVPFGRLEVGVEVDQADRVVIFGTSLIRSPLLERLQAKRAITLHAGVAPDYRGAASNFWAAYDGHLELVGGTVMTLAAAVDGGDIAARCVGPFDADPWRNGMVAVRVLQDLAVQVLAYPHSYPLRPQPPGAGRVTRHADYTEAVCAAYLARHGVIA